MNRYEYQWSRSFILFECNKSTARRRAVQDLMSPMHPLVQYMSPGICLNVCMNQYEYQWSRLLYPRHLCRGVYSFRLSVRPFVCSYVRSFVCSFVRTSFRCVEFVSKFCVKVSQVVYISATTHQKAFIFGP